MKTLLLLAFIALTLGEDNRYIVSIKKGASFDFAKSYVNDLGAKIVLEQPDFPFLAVVAEDANLVQKIAALEFVEYVEEDYRRYPVSTMKSSPEARAQAIEAALNASSGADPQVTPYGITMVQATSVADTSASVITLCIIDSGYDIKHEDLPTSTVTGYNSGWNTDGCSHGTHVAGTIAAVDNTIGVLGVMPHSKVKLYIVKVFGNDCAWSYSSTLSDAATRCQTAGAKVISMSLGGSTSSTTEQTTFNNLQTNGVLSVAAAGNDGTTKFSYPASYSSVMSIAAVDSTGTWASFSQYNSQVDLSAPGVGVLSTVNTGSGDMAYVWGGGNPGTLYTAYACVGTTSTYNSPRVDTGYLALCDCGEGTASCGTSCSGKICLMKRGVNNLSAKVTNCEAAGGKGAIVYNNVAGTFTGSLGTVTTKIPSATISLADGQTLLTKLGQSARVNVATSNYEYFDGTSMATPHASGVAALVWSYFPKCTVTTVRNTLTSTAKLTGGQTARTDKYGYGLIQASAAYNKLKTTTC